MSHLKLSLCSYKCTGFISLARTASLEPLMLPEAEGLMPLVTGRMLNHPSVWYWFAIRWLLFNAKIVWGSESSHTSPLTVIEGAEWMTLSVVLRSSAAVDSMHSPSGGLLNHSDKNKTSSNWGKAWRAAKWAGLWVLWHECIMLVSFCTTHLL